MLSGGRHCPSCRAAVGRGVAGWSGGVRAGRHERGGCSAGVYTSTQAERGKGLFVTSCGNCHGVDFKGAPDRAPALTGDAFFKNWEGRNVSNLFAKIKQDMPRNRAGSLTDAVPRHCRGHSASQRLSGGREGTQPGGAGRRAACREGHGRQQGRAQLRRRRNGGVPGPRGRQSLDLEECQRARGEQGSAVDVAGGRGRGRKPLGSGSFELISVIPFKPELADGHKIAARGLDDRPAPVASTSPRCSGWRTTALIDRGAAVAETE